MVPDVREAATHILVICAKLGCMKGSKMFSFGLGCSAMTCSASRVHGPHSLECGT
jgi:hypothetical protein